MKQTQIIFHSDKDRYFVDTEFMEDGHTVEPLSIGIVTNDGREYYAANADADLSKANAWVKENVIPHLPPKSDPLWRSKKTIADEVLEFVKPYGIPDENIEFWAYYCAYDWLVLAQLYGTMIQLPKPFPMFCFDLKPYSEMLNSPEHPPQNSVKHNALEDARWNKKLYEFLRAR